jgi:hypothetical protein
MVHSTTSLWAGQSSNRALIADNGKNFCPTIPCPRVRGDAVVEALRYKPEGRGFDSRWCHWNFSLT